MKTSEELIAEQLRDDPEFRRQWERTALARAVAVAIVSYRAEHDLSQRDLAQRLGMKQPRSPAWSLVRSIRVGTR